MPDNSILATGSSYEFFVKILMIMIEVDVLRRNLVQIAFV